MNDWKRFLCSNQSSFSLCVPLSFLSLLNHLILLHRTCWSCWCLWKQTDESVVWLSHVNAREQVCVLTKACGSAPTSWWFDWSICVHAEESLFWICIANVWQEVGSFHQRFESFKNQDFHEGDPNFFVGNLNILIPTPILLCEIWLLSWRVWVLWTGIWVLHMVTVLLLITQVKLALLRLVKARGRDHTSLLRRVERLQGNHEMTRWVF